MLIIITSLHLFVEGYYKRNDFYYRLNASHEISMWVNISLQRQVTSNEMSQGEYFPKLIHQHHLVFRDPLYSIHQNIPAIKTPLSNATFPSFLFSITPEHTTNPNRTTSRPPGRLEASPGAESTWRALQYLDSSSSGNVFFNPSLYETSSNRRKNCCRSDVSNMAKPLSGPHPNILSALRRTDSGYWVLRCSWVGQRNASSSAGWLLRPCSVSNGSSKEAARWGAVSGTSSAATLAAS